MNGPTLPGHHPSAGRPPAGETDWDAIFRGEFVRRPHCWKTCDSFCCKPTRVTQHFLFLRSRGVDLPHLPGEYHYLETTGHLQAGFADTFTRHRLRLPNGRTMPLYRAVCTLDGTCSDHRYRPLVCRVYPFMPVPTLDGDLERTEPTALIDIFWNALETSGHPCTITEMDADEWDAYRALCRELFKDPVNILYFKAASIYKNTIMDSVRRQYPELLEQPEEIFFSRWEKLLVMGKLYHPGEVLEKIAAVCDGLEARLGRPLALEGT